MAVPARIVFDDGVLQQRLKAIQKELGEKSAKAGAITLVEEFRDRMVRISPRDTNRYLRGWMQACGMAGVPAPLPVIKASSRQNEFLSALEQQRDWWAARVSGLKARKQLWFDNRDNLKKTKYRDKLVQQIARAEKRLEAAERQLGAAIVAGDGFLVIDGGFAALNGQWSAYSKAAGKNAFKKRTVTIRWKVYGGSGRITVRKGVATIGLRNLEPHSAILEAKGHYAAIATGGMARGRVKINAGKAMVKGLAKHGVRPVA